MNNIKKSHCSGRSTDHSLRKTNALEKKNSDSAYVLCFIGNRKETGYRVSEKLKCHAAAPDANKSTFRLIYSTFHVTCFEQEPTFTTAASVLKRLAQLKGNRRP
jgi:hypothetical protein